MVYLGTVPTTEHYMLGDWSTSLPIRHPGNCTDHWALHARGLVDQSTHPTSWGLYRPLSIICSRTGRPVYPSDILGTIPTTEHSMLGNWSNSLPIVHLRGCTDHRALHARGLVDQSAFSTTYGLHQSSSTTYSGTGRLVRFFKRLGTVPNVEHDVLRNWLIGSLSQE